MPSKSVDPNRAWAAHSVLPAAVDVVVTGCDAISFASHPPRDGVPSPAPCLSAHLTAALANGVSPGRSVDETLAWLFETADRTVFFTGRDQPKSEFIQLARTLVLQIGFLLNASGEADWVELGQCVVDLGACTADVNGVAVQLCANGVTPADARMAAAVLAGR